MPDYNPVKQASSWIDALLSPISKPLGEIGGGLAGSVARLVAPQYEERVRKTVQQVGEATPRFLGEAALYGAKNPLVKLAGLGDVAMRAYSEPGQDIPGALMHTTAFAAAPAVGGLGQRVGNMIAPTVERAATSPGAKFLAGEAARRVGSASGAVLPFTAADALEAYRRGQPFDPLSLENVVGTAASVLPFEALHVPKVVKGYQEATKPLVIKTPVTDQVQNFRVHWETPEGPRSRDFTGEEPAGLFRDELQKKGLMPMLEPAGTVARQYVEHSMAFKPEQVQQGFGWKSSEVLNEMGDKPLKGSQVLGTLKNKVPSTEWEALPGLEEFVKGKEKVSPREVDEWIRENGPRVEVRKAGEVALGPEQQELLELRHWADTTGFAPDLNGRISFFTDRGYRDVPLQDTSNLVANGMTMEDISKARRLKELSDKNIEKPEESYWTANWSFVSPKPEDQMEGYVELAVVRPLNKDYTLSTIDQRFATAKEKQDAGIKFPSSHSFPPNTLGFSRGYMETTPEGKRVFHVVEVQSDWAARIREEKETQSSQHQYGRIQDDPLLRHWERLTLKATIQHAVEQGADEIAISDPETAMMTEGHDMNVEPPKSGFYILNRNNERISKLFDTEKEANDFFNKVKNDESFRQQNRFETSMKPDPDEGFSGYNSINDLHVGFVERGKIRQEPGMRLHYGQTLPKILQELTDHKGVKISFGEHQNKMGGIFQDEKGNPKTAITALSFPLDQFKKEFAKRGGIPLIGSRYITAHVKEMQQEGYEPDQIVESVENIKKLRPLKGESPLQALARETGLDPRLFSQMEGKESLDKAFDFLTSMFHYNYGEPVERAAYLARQVMTPLARFSPWLKNTHLAISPAEEAAGKFYATKNPNSEVFNYLITLHDFPKGKMNARQSLESQVFEVARMLGHEATHNALHGALNPIGQQTDRYWRSAIKALVQVESIPPEQRAPILHNMLRLIVPANRWPEISKVNFQRSAESSEEFLADFAAIISVGSLKKKSLRNLMDALTFGDEASKDFSVAVYRDLTSIWKGVKEWLGMTPDENKDVQNAVGEIYDNLTTLMATKEEASRTLDAFNAYMERASAGPFDPPPVASRTLVRQMMSRLDSLEDVAKNEKAMELEELVNEELHPNEGKVGGERLSFWRDYFKPMAQLVETLKEKVPSVVPVFSLAMDYRGQASELQKQTWEQFTNEKGKMDWKRLRWVAQQGSSQNKAFNAIALVENVRTQREGAKELLTRAEREKVSEDYKGLSDEDKDRVDNSLEQLNSMARFLALKKHDAFKDRVAWGMAKVIMSYNKNLYHDKAKAFADQAVRAVFENDPAVEGVFASIPIADPAKLNLRQKIEENKVQWIKMGDKMMGPVDPATGLRPGKTFYLPEVRVGDWHIAYKLKNEDVPHHEAFKTQIEAARRWVEIRKNPELEWDKTFNAKDRADRFRGMVQEDISAVQQDALDVLYNSVLSSISMEHPEAQEIVDRIKKEVQPASAFANIAVSPYMREREFIPGREDLNMVEGMIRYVDASAYNVAKSHVKQATIAALYNPDFRANPNVRNEFDKYVHFVTDAEGKEFTLLKNMVFFNYIGFNPATMIQEPVQQLVSLVPYLVEHGMGVGEAYKALRKANLLMVQHSVKKKLDDPVLNRALNEAIDQRTVDTGYISDLYGETDFDFASGLSAVVGKDSIRSRADLLSRPLYQMLSVARHTYGYVTAANSKTAFLAAFNMEYEKSKSYDKAMQFATQATRATMFGGGKAARPMALQRFGSMGGIGGLMYTLGSYSLNSIAMMGRLARKAILDSNLEPTEKKSAMKAAGLMFATQLALAGALGLPLVAPGLAVLEQLFPDLDAKLLVRKGAVSLAKLVSNDEDVGHMVADGALRGALNLTGVDFGSRFQLANLMGVSPYDGFSWDNLMGPAASMMKNWTKGTGQAAGGNFSEAARTMSPTFLRNWINLVHDDWAVRDKAGRLIATMTPAEKTMAALGFKPNRLTSYYEEQRIRERVDDRKRDQTRDLRQEVAKLMVQGNMQEARKRIMEGYSEVGPYDPFQFAKEAATLAQDMLNPIVQRTAPRSSVMTQAEIAGLYPKTVGQTEVQRMLLASQMARQTGFYDRISPSSVRHAALVDSIMASNPTLTLPQARLLAEQMTSRTARRHMAGLPQG